MSFSSPEYMVAFTAANILGRSVDHVADPVTDLSDLAMPARYDVNPIPHEVSLPLAVFQSKLPQCSRTCPHKR